MGMVNMHKRCRCGAIESGAWPIYCQRCQTYTHTCYTEEFRSGKQDQNETSTTEVVIESERKAEAENRKAEAEEEYEVVWNGGPLLPDRDQHPDPTWEAPKQQVNKNRKPLSLERDGN